MSWYRVHTGRSIEGIQAIERLGALTQAWSVDIAKKTGDASDVAMFWWHDIETDEHYAYFPPSIEQLARTLKGAEKTAEPQRSAQFSLQVAANAAKAWAQVKHPDEEE